MYQGIRICIHNQPLAFTLDIWMMCAIMCVSWCLFPAHPYLNIERLPAYLMQQSVLSVYIVSDDMCQRYRQCPVMISAQQKLFMQDSQSDDFVLLLFF